MKRSKVLKFFLIFIGIIIILGAVLFYFFNPKKAIELILPDLSKVTFINANIINGDSIHSKADIIVQNKSPYKLSIDSVFFRVELNKKQLIEEHVPMDLKQERYQVDTVVLPIDLSRKKLKEILSKLKSVDSTDLDVYCYVVYNTIFGNMKLKYNKTIRIPTPIPPQIKVVKVERKRFNLLDKMLEANIQLEIINRGKNINLQLQNIRYKLEVGDHSLSSEGTIDKTVTIKPESTSYLEIPVEIKVEQPLKTIAKILTDNDKTDYILHLKANMTEHMVNKSTSTPIPIEIEAEGNLELKK
ncbi:MAG TPA: LEA type 2 family protein [Bacteroidia bacterium]|jgi:LEA14-like dessication related protein|nr:LEA type 2 family protein [Bacteroidia bacterium]